MTENSGGSPNKSGEEPASSPESMDLTASGPLAEEAKAAMARQAAESERDQAASARKAAESERAQVTTARQAAELERDLAATARQATEAARDQAVIARQATDSEHIQAATARQITESERDQTTAARKKVEAARDKAAEAQQAAEAARDLALVATQTAESERDQAAVARQAAETEQGHAAAARQAAESDRDAATTAAGEAEVERDRASAAREIAVSEQNQSTSAKEIAEAQRDQVISAREIAEQQRDQSKLAREIVDAEIELARKAHNLSTTVGLAGAFNVKANSAKAREYIWTVALIGALAVAFSIGAARYADMLIMLANKPNIETLAAFGLISIFGITPFIWIAWMATRMIGKNFALTEDYAYKAALAQAYVGFRDEAKKLDPIFEQRLFAAAVSHLDANPVRFVNADHPGSPLQDLLQQPFMKEVLQDNSFKQSLVDWLKTRFGWKAAAVTKSEASVRNEAQP